MKKALSFIFFALIALTTLKAQTATQEQTQVAAFNFYKTMVDASAGNPQLAFTGNASRDGEACLYIYNIDNGFVIVSADTRVKPILGYSTEGAFDPQNFPEGVGELLDGYCQEIAAVRQHVAEPDELLRSEWQSLMDGSYEPRRSGRAVAALLDDETGINNWQQNNGYNYYCPADANGPAGKCYVGCCALSMGQVMHYWQHPAQGVGSHSYECNHSSYLNGQYGDYGTLSANFGATTYNFSLMPNNLNSSTPSNQILAIAKLLYHCGVAIEMWYGNQGSMGFHDDIADALETYFKYDECLTVWKNSYSGDWEDLLKSDLDLGRPIIYCAYAAEGGHEFVCDGYNNNDYFHFNMGWGGSYNGYYAIDNLNAQYNFNSTHGAVAHIHPIQESSEGIEDESITIGVHPNPAHNTLTVESASPIREITVYDQTGRAVIVGTFHAPSLQQAINTSSLPTGIYIVKVMTDHGIESAKFVKN